jgi:spore germination cell wall hydrolase CwlJ-like protein
MGSIVRKAQCKPVQQGLPASVMFWHRFGQGWSSYSKSAVVRGNIPSYTTFLVTPVGLASVSMRARGENRGAASPAAEADGFAGGQPNLAGPGVDAPVEDDVTGRALRMLQLHDDARQEFERAEEKLKTVRHTIDRALAGDIDPEEPRPIAVAPVTEVVVEVVPKRRRYLAASFVLAGLVAGWFTMSALDAARDPDVAASRRAIVSEAVAAVVPERDAPAAAATGDQADFGQTIYAARFAKAPAAERTCLARAVYYEARGEDMAGQIAVAQVVLNRARSKKWPDTICGVVNQGIERGEKCQFSFACFSKLSEPSGEMWDQAQLVADQALRGQAWLRELVEATHYHTTGVAPVWRTGLSQIATIGTHVFYREGDGLRASANDSEAYGAAADAQALRAKSAGGVNKAARLKTITGEATAAVPKKTSPGHGGDWKANVFAQ